MKAWAISLGSAALLLAGCGQEQQFVDNLVRQAVEPGGNVQEINMTRQADATYAGFATVRKADGKVGRYNCTVRNTQQKDKEGRDQFEASCLPTLDEALLSELDTALRRHLESQGVSVVNLSLRRQDDNNAVGTARVRDPAGNEADLNCTLPRDPVRGFSMRCQPTGEQAGSAEQSAPEEAPAQE